MKIKPFYTYVFRRWHVQEGMCAQVVIIRSEQPLYSDQLRARLQNVTHEPPESFVYIEPGEDCSISLDTWQREIESCQPIDAVEAYRAYKHWDAMSTMTISREDQL